MVEEANETASTVRSIERAFEILRILRESRVPLRLSDIARESGIHLATTQRIVNALVRFDYVLQENVGYTIGITSVLNSHTFLVSNGLIQIAQPVLQELAKSTGFASSISVRVEMKQIQLSRVEGNVPLPYQLPVGELMPLHLGGARILAAALEPEVLDILLQSIREIRLATGEIVTHADFVESLKEIRDQGYVHGFSQRELGAASVAVPVIGREGKVIASLQLSWVSGDVGHGKIDWHVAELKRASAAISRRLP